MQVFGFTINLLTLLAIVLSVGLVVDDAIVVVENVERHLGEGRSPLEAASEGRSRTGRPDHRHDRHAGGSLRPHRSARGAHRLALSRVRLYTGRSSRHLRGRGPDPLAHDVGKDLETGNTGCAVSQGKSRGTSSESGSFYGRLLDITLDSRPAVYAVWIFVSLPCSPHVHACRPWNWPRQRIRG